MDGMVDGEGMRQEDLGCWGGLLVVDRLKGCGVKFLLSILVSLGSTYRPEKGGYAELED